MSAGTFLLRVVTPLAVFEREATHLRLKDRTGYFGVMRGHADFLTLLETCLGSWRTAAGEARFLAVDSGFLLLEGGTAVVASPEAIDGDDPAQLGRVIAAAHARRLESERIFSRVVEGLQREFLEKTVGLFRGGT